MRVEGEIMTGSGIFSYDIWAFADICVEAGLCRGFEDKHYILLMMFHPRKRAEIRRGHVNFLLPSPCRVWLCKGKKRFFLGDSHALPVDLSAGVSPPFLG